MANLKVFAINPENNQITETNYGGNINADSVDAGLALARSMLTAQGFRVRSVNCSPNDEMVAYVYISGQAYDPGPAPGWVYRKPTLPSTT